MSDDANPDAGEDEGRARSALWTAAPLTAWAFAFVLLRIFAVAQYDWETAFNVSTTLSLSDGLTLVFGSLMGGHVLVEALLVVLLPLLVGDYLWAPHGHRPVVILPTIVAAVILVAVTLSYRSWWLPAATAAVFGVFALVQAMSDRSPARRVLGIAVRRAGLVSGIGILVAAAFMQTPWVPREHIETTHGEITGYVLGVDPGFLNVLTDDHEFVILPTGEVLSRK